MTYGPTYCTYSTYVRMYGTVRGSFWRRRCLSDYIRTRRKYIRGTYVGSHSIKSKRKSYWEKMQNRAEEETRKRIDSFGQGTVGAGSSSRATTPIDDRQAR